MKSLNEIIAKLSSSEWRAAHSASDDQEQSWEPDDAERMRMMGVPPLYRDVPPSLTPPDRGRLYIGEPGTGKTWTACGDLLALARAGDSCRWLSIPAYTAAIRAREPVPSLRSLKALDAIVLDDIAQSTPPEWMLDTLYTLVDTLLNNRVLVIATSNCDRIEIARRYGDAIASRLMRLCSETVSFAGPDRRLR